MQAATAFQLNTKFENNPQECKSLAAVIAAEKRFIICFGQNKHGELGLSTVGESQSDPTAIVIPDDFNSSQSISSGSHHSALVTKAGELYVCGSALHGKLGINGLSVNNISKFQRINIKATIRQVACGDYHTLALAKDGTVFTWGGSLHKKAAGGCEPTVVEAFVELGVSIVQVDCGDCHSVCLDSDGMVYAWGGGGSAYNKGQCGHGHLNDTDEPKLVKALISKPVVQISAGGYHTLALCQTGELYAWGSNQYGECANKSLQP